MVCSSAPAPPPAGWSRAPCAPPAPALHFLTAFMALAAAGVPASSFPSRQGGHEPCFAGRGGWGRAAFQIRGFLPKMPAWSLAGAQDPSCSSLPPAPWGQPLLVQFRITSTEPSGHQKEILFFLTRAFSFFFPELAKGTSLARSSLPDVSTPLRSFGLLKMLKEKVSRIFLSIAERHIFL